MYVSSQSRTQALKKLVGSIPMMRVYLLNCSLYNNKTCLHPTFKGVRVLYVYLACIGKK